MKNKARNPDWLVVSKTQTLEEKEYEYPYAYIYNVFSKHSVIKMDEIRTAVLHIVALIKEDSQ
jgi:hypothetical protein